MRKFTFLFSFVLCALFINAQTIVFNETFGTEGPSGSAAKPKVGDYTGYDNGSPVTFTGTTTDYADVRSTSTINTHVWFPANKSTDLVISGIATEGHDNLKLSFDVTHNSQSASNMNNLTLYCNDVEITVPSVEIPKQHEYVNSGEISIPNADVTKLRFYFTAEKNTIGFRLDNVKITSGSSGGTNLIATIENAPMFYVSGNQISVNNMEEGTMVEIYSAVGAKVATSFVVGNTVELNNTLNKGIYIIKAGNYTQKIMF